MYQYQIKQFDQFDAMAFYRLARLRIDVFVVEQACAYPELDDYDIDPETRHLMVYENDALVACARCLAPNENRSEPAIGRVLVAPEARGKGLAGELMKRAIDCCRTLWPGRDIKISAQTYLLDFYGGLGFVAEGESYLEDGIPHQDMRLQAQ